MSEYNPNDHLHNVTESVMQITRQAQGVQDITGANVADYEEISPDAAASVTLSNARKDVPFLALVNNLPPVQEGSGTPALDNVRALTPYTKSIIRNGSSVVPIDVDLPDAMYGGYVDYINKKIVIDIIRVRIPYIADWQTTVVEGTYFVPADAIPYYDKGETTRYAVGENVVVKWGSATNAGEGELLLFTQPDQYPGRIYYKPFASAEIADVNSLKAWLRENPLYIYYRPVAVTEIPLEDASIPYVLDNNYSVSADSGTLTVKYLGIAPDEP